MSRPALEVADIFRGHGPAWRRANAGHVSLGQLKVMSEIENCRTAALGGHVARCEECAHSQIAYTSCRNRHCPKCQGAAAKDWVIGSRIKIAIKERQRHKATLHQVCRSDGRSKSGCTGRPRVDLVAALGYRVPPRADTKHACVVTGQHLHR